MARSIKRYKKVCRWMWYIPEDKKPYGSTSEKADSKWNTREAMNISNSRFYYKTAVSSREECDF